MNIGVYVNHNIYPNAIAIKVKIVILSIYESTFYFIYLIILLGTLI